MKSKLKLMFCFVCLSAIYAGFAHAQGIGDRNRPLGRGTYKIVGKVYLPDGRPASGIEVRADGAEMNSGTSTRTGIDGEFAISGLSSGNYNVVVGHKGYETETESLTIAEGMARGSTYQLVFNLRMAGQKKGDTYSMNPLFRDVPKSALDKYKKAMEKMQANDAKAAILLLDAAIAEHPSFAAAYYERGLAHMNQKNIEAAVESFAKSISIKPDYLEAKYGYGLAMFEKKNYEVSEAVFRDVLKTRDMPEAHMNLGISLFYLKDQAAAETELKTAIAANGDKLAMAHLYLGQIYIQRKQNASAVTELEKYLELVPKAPNAERIKAAIAELKKQG
jgi:Tfp pilus assembly protein PilF